MLTIRFLVQPPAQVEWEENLSAIKLVNGGDHVHYRTEDAEQGKIYIVTILSGAGWFSFGCITGDLFASDYVDFIK